MLIFVLLIIFFFYISGADGGTKCTMDGGDFLADVLCVPALLRDVLLVILFNFSLLSVKSPPCCKVH